MKLNARVCASLATLFALVSFTHAANPPTPAAGASLAAFSLQAVETEDPTGYAMWVSKTNEIAKAKLGVDEWYTTYLGVDAGKNTGVVFNVHVAENFKTLLTHGSALQKDADILQNAQHYRGLRKLGQRQLFQSVRVDGHYTGGVIYNTEVNLTDEAAYLKALEQLRSLFDSHGLKDVYINVYRVAAGRSDSSHIVSMNLSSTERLGDMLDQLAQPWMRDWLGSVAKIRTVVSNGTYRDITVRK